MIIPEGATHTNEYSDFYIVRPDGLIMFYNSENGWDGLYDKSIVRGTLIEVANEMDELIIKLKGDE